MAARHAPTLTHGAENLFEGFENLMPFRVHDILLVSSLYDSFILREDGRLNELLMKESLDLHLQNVPGISHVSSGSEALELARVAAALQPDRHQPASWRHECRRTGSPGEAGRTRCSGDGARLRPSRNQGLHRAHGRKPTSSGSSCGRATDASSSRWSSTSKTSATCSTTPKS